MGRWDRFHEARSLTPEALLAEEVVKTLVSDLAGWPPPIDGGWLDETVKARFAPLFVPRATRPKEAVFRAAFQLARWELAREFEKIDDFARNGRAAAIGGDERETLALHFLHRWLTDSMLEILEVSRLKRPKLGECLVRAEIRLFG